MNFLNNMGNSGQLIVLILVYAVVFGGMYFVMRSQQKKKKQEEAIKNNLKLGDEITTIGGIVGRIINIKEDTDCLVIESGNDKIRIKRWAVASVDNKTPDSK